MRGYIQHERVGLAMCRDQAEVLNTCLWLEIISYAWKIVKLHSIGQVQRCPPQIH